MYLVGINLTLEHLTREDKLRQSSPSEPPWRPSVLEGVTQCMTCFLPLNVPLTYLFLFAALSGPILISSNAYPKNACTVGRLCGCYARGGERGE